MSGTIPTRPMPASQGSRTRLLTTFALLLIATFALGLFAAEQTDGVGSTPPRLKNNWLPASLVLGDMGRFADRMHLNQARLASTVSEQDRMTRIAAITEQSDRFEAALKAYELSTAVDDTEVTAEEAGLARTLQNNWTNYKTLSARYQDLMLHGRQDEALALENHEMRDEMLAFRQAIAADLDFQIRESNQSSHPAAAADRSVGIWIWAVLCGMVVLCIAIGWMLIRGSSLRIADIAVAMRRLAKRAFKPTGPSTAAKLSAAPVSGNAAITTSGLVPASTDAALRTIGAIQTAGHIPRPPAGVTTAPDPRGNLNTTISATRPHHDPATTDIQPTSTVATAIGPPAQPDQTATPSTQNAATDPTSETKPSGGEFVSFIAEARAV